MDPPAKKWRHASSPSPWSVGNNLTAPTLWAPTIPIGSRKKRRSHSRGADRRDSVTGQERVRLAWRRGAGPATSATATRRPAGSGRLHFVPRRLILRTESRGDVLLRMGLRLRQHGGVVQAEHLDQVGGHLAGVDGGVQRAIGVVVDQPLPGL